MSHVVPTFRPLVQRCYPISDGLVGCYPGYVAQLRTATTSILDDISGQGRSSTGSLGINAAVRSQGLFGPCFNLASSASQAFNMGNQDWGNTNTGSISCFVNTGVAANNVFWTIVGRGGDAITSAGFFLFEIGRTGAGVERIRICLKDDGTVSDNDQLAANSPNVTNTGWHHLCWTANGAASGWILYMDGRPLTLTINSGSNAGKWMGQLNVTGTPNSFIGALRFNGTNTNFFNGQLCDIRLYNRALTPAEVSLINAGLG